MFLIVHSFRDGLGIEFNLFQIVDFHFPMSKQVSGHWWICLHWTDGLPTQLCCYRANIVQFFLANLERCNCIDFNPD